MAASKSVAGGFASVIGTIFGKTWTGATKVRETARKINHAGGDQACTWPGCGQIVSNRKIAQHMSKHAMAQLGRGQHPDKPKRVNLHAPPKRGRRPVTGTTGGPPPGPTSPPPATSQPRPAVPTNPNKTNARSRRPTGQGTAPHTSQGTTQPKGKTVPIGRGKTASAGGGGGGRSIASGFAAWAGDVPKDLASLEASLRGAEAGVKSAAASVGEYIQGLIGMKIHPEVVRPLEQAQQMLLESASEYVRAFMAFHRVYANRIAHIEQAGPKPDSEFFDGSAA